MAYRFNPFTGNLSYYEKGLPSGGSEGQVLRKASDSDEWEWADETSGNDGINTVPGSNFCKVTNLYVDPSTGKLIVEYDDNPIL